MPRRTSIAICSEWPESSENCYARGWARKTTDSSDEREEKAELISFGLRSGGSTARIGADGRDEIRIRAVLCRVAPISDYPQPFDPTNQEPKSVVLRS